MENKRNEFLELLNQLARRHCSKFCLLLREDREIWHAESVVRDWFRD